MPIKRKLRIWILRQAEPVVFHPGMKGAKPMRATLLARELARRGHDVIWWTGAFEHFTKSHLEPAGALLETEIPGLRYFLIPSPGYRRNVSLARLRDHAALARNWEAAVANMTPPDIVICSFPIVDLAYAAVRYGMRHDVPVIIDVRDMWPDVIYDRLRAKLHLPFLPRFLRGYERRSRFVFANACAIMGITDAFVDWALRRGGRQRTEMDRAFLLSSPPLHDLAPEEKDAAAAFWRERLPEDFRKRLTFAWTGTLLDTRVSRDFLRAVATLPKGVARRTCMVICGSGGLQEEVHNLARQHEHIVFAGWVDRAALAHLLSRTDYGVIPYERSRDFQASVPNKVSEYLSAGAHLLTTLDGELGKLLGNSGVFRVMPAVMPGMREMLIRLIREGKPPREERARAKEWYHRLFDSSIIYPAMADHVERVALGGKKSCGGKS